MLIHGWAGVGHIVNSNKWGRGDGKLQFQVDSLQAEVHNLTEYQVWKLIHGWAGVGHIVNSNKWGRGVGW